MVDAAGCGDVFWGGVRLDRCGARVNSAGARCSE
jgi:hypothetical protein